MLYSSVKNVGNLLKFYQNAFIPVDWTHIHDRHLVDMCMSKKLCSEFNVKLPYVHKDLDTVFKNALYHVALSNQTYEQRLQQFKQLQQLQFQQYQCQDYAYKTYNSHKNDLLACFTLLNEETNDARLVFDKLLKYILPDEPVVTLDTI